MKSNLTRTTHKNKFYKRFLILTLLSLITNIAFGIDVTYNGLKYNVDTTTKTATCTGLAGGGNGRGDLVIPDYIEYNGEKYPVTKIGYLAFQFCSGFTGSLTIGNSVTEIGSGAFYGCSGFTGSLTIGNSVTTIGEYAFTACYGFTGWLTIPSSVTSIGSCAFIDCSGFTGSLTIPDSVTEIGTWAFGSCTGFTGSLTIPDSVSEIGEDAFFDCYGFTGTLSLGESVSSIGENAFYNTNFAKVESYNPNPPQCDDEIFSPYPEQLYVPAGSIELYRTADVWKNFLYIGTFGDSGIEAESVTCNGLRYNVNTTTKTATCTGLASGVNASGKLIIPDYIEYNDEKYPVTEIGNWAFIDCSGFSGSLTIGNSVTKIGGDAFRGCSGFTGSLTIPNSVTEIGNYAFYGCSGFSGSLTIGNSVTEIGNYAFVLCSGFTGSLTIPDLVTKIGDWAFYGCSGFTGSLTIGNSATTIGEYAFEGCWRFSGTLSLGESVSSIGGNAFYNTSFTKVESYNPNPPQCYYAVFSSYPKQLYVPAESIELYKAAEVWKNFSYIGSLDGSEIEPGTVTYNGLSYSLDTTSKTATCTGLADGGKGSGDLVIPDYIIYKSEQYSVTEIGESAFSGCSGFTGSLTIGNSVTEIGWGAFTACSGFTGSLTIPDSVTSIGYYAFYGCSGFTGSLTIGNSVTIIGEYAFWGCSGFTGSLTIPNSVTEIGDGAFSGCSGFTGSLTIPDSVTTIEYGAFSGCPGFTGSLTIPDSVTTIEEFAFSDCSGFTGSLTIPDSVTIIEDYAFSGCSGFTGSLTIGNSVTVIGGYAFYDCYGFTGILSLGESVSSIGGVAFDYTNFAKVYSYNPNPPICTNEIFSRYPFQLYVPATSIELYKGANVWKSFSYIDSIEGSEIDNGLSYSVDTTSKTATCTGLAEGGKGSGDLVIPDYIVYNGQQYTVTKIGNYAFWGCSGFTGSLTIGNSVTTIGEYAFEGCSGFTGSLTIPNSITEIGDRAFYGCYGFNGSLTIGNSVTEIGEMAFMNCYGFTGSLTIGNSVNEIGEMAFMSCYGFTGSLTIPNSVTTIGNRAFNSCLGFTGSLTIGNSVTEIGYGAFLGCSGFTGSLTIPDTATAIGGQAFDYCSGFTETLSLGESVSSIGSSAFRETNFAKVESHNPTPPTCQGDIFSRYPVRLYVPAGSIELYRTADIWKNFSYIGILQGSQIEVESISLSPEVVTLLVGESCQFTVTVSPSEAETSLTWQSSDPMIAFVDNDGVVKGIVPGQAFIYATAQNGVTGIAIVRITDPNAGENPDFGYGDNGVYVSAVRIREGDSLGLFAERPTGYENNDWTYEWYLNGVLDAEGKYVNVTAGQEAGWLGNSKTIETESYEAQISNLAGDLLILELPRVSVYSRPLTPVLLIRDGNGDSYSFIAMSSLPDSELERLGYSFVFGYTDAEGVSHVISNGISRYCHTSKDIYNNSDYRFWVYTAWTFPDGAIITSGLRYLDGELDESFDRSNFNFDPSGGVETIEGDYEITVYTLDGHSVGKDLDRLAPGLYIIRERNGNQVTSRKIIIR